MKSEKPIRRTTENKIIVKKGIRKSFDKMGKIIKEILMEDCVPMRYSLLEKKVIKKLKSKLRELENKNMIIFMKGKYLWIHNPSKKLDKAIKEGIEI